jgi:hypothetical protein
MFETQIQQGRVWIQWNTWNIEDGWLAMFNSLCFEILLNKSTLGQHEKVEQYVFDAMESSLDKMKNVLDMFEVTKFGRNTDSTNTQKISKSRMQ